MVNRPLYTVCNVPGCPELTRGNYCTAHVELTPAEEADEIRRLRRDREQHDEHEEGDS